MKKAVYIVSSSALDIVRRIRAQGAEGMLTSHAIETLDNCASSLTAVREALARLNPELLRFIPPQTATAEAPLYIAVPNKSQRPAAAGLVAQVTGGAPSPNTFFRLDENIFVLTPQACFVQAIPKLSIPRRILLAMELAGSYTFSPALGEYKFDVPNVSTIERLRAYCSCMPHSRGTKLGATINALRWALDNSASPMETAVHAMLALPYRLGGYGLRPPILNPAFDKNGNAVPPETKGCIKPDLAWFDADDKPLLALEYNSREFHCGIDDYEYDADRREDLEKLGFKVIPVSRRKAYDPELFHELACEVAHMTSKTLRLPDDFARRRELLRSEVLPRRTNSMRSATRRRTVPEMRPSR